MRKYIVCLATALFISFITEAQDKTDKGYFSLAGGISLPLGNYRNTNLSNDNAGFASIGPSINLSYCRLLGKRLGIAVEARGQQNPLNVHAMEKEFSQVEFVHGGFTAINAQSPPPTNNATYTTFQNWNFTRKSWQLCSLMAGGYGESPLSNSENISLTLKAMIGAAYLSAPKLSGTGYTDTSFAEVSQSGAKAFGFAYSVSAGIKCSLNKKFILLFDAEYVGTANIVFKNVTETELLAYGLVIPHNLSVANATIIEEFTNTGTNKQKVSSLNISIGIGYKL